MTKCVEIYGLHSCRFSVAAVAYCERRGYLHVFNDISYPLHKADMLRRAPHAVATPQIFIGEHRIGNLVSLHRSDAIIQQILGGN